MTPERWERISEIFHGAGALEGHEREDYLASACNGDSALRQEVETLLAAGADAGNFISEPLVGAFASDILRGFGPQAEQVVGHYRIISRLGSGGMGEVFLAQDTKLGRKVAIKTLSPLFDNEEGFKKRFRNEARAAATLHHPNVATIFAVDEYNGRPFIAMEYIDGRTLDKAIPAGGLDPAVFAKWFRAIAAGIGHAHSKGIVHRDIKPGNIIIDNDKVPKILDFGLACAVPGSPQAHDHSLVTETGQVIGTPSYMSPEQARGEEIDHRSDIFSLGIVMYEALTGKRPFAGDSHAEIVSNLLKSEPEPLSRLRSDIPAPITVLVERCLSKRRSARIQTADEIAAVLQAYMRLSSRGATTDSSLRRFYREVSTPSALWLIAAAAAVIVLAIGGWYFISRPSETPRYSVDRMSMRKLSQSNDVALSVIAPDGRSVAYVTYEEDDSRSLWLRRVTDSNAIRIVPSQQVHYWDIAFSIDSEQIYFITAPRFGTHGTLFRVSSLGGQARKVSERVNHLGNVSTDGKRVLFVRYGDAAPNTSVNVTDSRLITASSEDGSDEQVVKVLEGESVILKARFSSGGRRVFYIKRELDGVEYWSIVMLNPQDGSEQEVIRQKERIDALATIPNENGLLVNAVDGTSNRRQLFHVSIPSGEMTRITNDLNNYIGVSVDREGRNIVTVQRTDQSRVWVGSSVDFRSMAPLTREPLAHGVADWTPDGRIVFDVLENDRLSVWVADADGKNALQLTPQDSDNSSPRVSGDGRFIVFTSRRAGFNQIWRMNIDGSNQILLADAPGITQFPQVAADGKTVVFRWYNEDSPPMGQVSVDGGPVTGIEYLPNASTYYWAMSPDGRYIAYTIGGDAGVPMKVVVRPVDSNTPKAILNIRPIWFFKWMPDSKNLFYQESQQGEGLSTKVFKIDPDKGEPELLLTTEPDNIVDLSFSRDNTRFAAVRLKVLTDAVMLTATGTTTAER